MPVPLSGLQDYAKRMQSNMGGDPNSHPATQKFLQTTQDAVNKTSASISAPPVDPSNPGSNGGGLSSTPNTNPNNPTTQNDMPNIPTTEQMAGSGNVAGAISSPSHADAISNNANAQVSAPQVDPFVLQSQQETNALDPAAEMGKAADYAVAARQNAYKIQQERAAASQGSQGVMGGSSVGGLNNVSNVNGFNGDQLGNAKQIISDGIARGMSRNDIQTALMTSLAESGLQNLKYGDQDSLGLFQQRSSEGWGTAQQIMDPNYAANKFYDSLSGIKNRDSMTPWQAAQAVQRSGFADGSNYQRQFGKAQSLMNALYNDQGQGQQIYSPNAVKPNGSLSWISHNTGKYLDYDHYFGAQCVDLYAFYATGFAGGTAPPVGTADQIWNNHDTKAFAQIGRNVVPQMGDVAIFAKGPGTPGSHVGIITQDNGNGTVRTLSNNATSAGPNGNSTIVDLSKQNIIGYLRPRRLM